MSEKTDKKMQGLKPCPFCGGNSIDITTSGVNPRSWLIGCEDCLCRLTSNDESRELGIELWNTRSNEQLQAELDKYNWIAVDDKLPPKNIPIWLYNSEFNYTHKASLLYPETYLNNNPHETHWMPLPDPPQTEKEEGSLVVSGTGAIEVSTAGRIIYKETEDLKLKLKSLIEKWDHQMSNMEIENDSEFGCKIQIGICIKDLKEIVE